MSRHSHSRQGVPPGDLQACRTRRHGRGNEDSKWTGTGYAKTRDLGFVANYVSKAAFAKQQPHFVRILIDWDLIAGDGLVELAYPKKMAGGVLTLTAAGPAALQIRHMSAVLTERVNRVAGLIGVHAVQRIKIVQGVPPARLKAPTGNTARKRSMRGRLNGAGLAEVLETVEDAELRDSLERMARAMFAISE